MDSFSPFPKLLGQKIDMKVNEAENGLLIESGSVYVAKANNHLFVNYRKRYLSNGPRENLLVSN
jgi:chemotaxis response regulator CheB